MLYKYKECEVCDGSTMIEKDSKYYDCGNCNGRGEIEIPIGEDEIVFVNVYSITREYGGPEEGGWWYNDYNCIAVIPTLNLYSGQMKLEMEKRYESRKHGNIYSVLGGTDIEVHIEENPKQSETKERPHYE